VFNTVGSGVVTYEFAVRVHSELLDDGVNDEEDLTKRYQVSKGAENLAHCSIR